MKKAIVISTVAMLALGMTACDSKTAETGGYANMGSINNMVVASIGDIQLPPADNYVSLQGVDVVDRNVIKDANVYNAPRADASVVGNLVTNDTARLVRLLDDEQYYMIIYKGRVAYIAADAVEKKAEDTQLNRTNNELTNLANNAATGNTTPTIVNNGGNTGNTNTTNGGGNGGTNTNTGGNSGNNSGNNSGSGGTSGGGTTGGGGTTPVNPDPVNPDPVNPDPENPDPVNPDPVNPDPENPDPVNPDPVNPDPENPDPVNPDPVNPDPVNPDPVESDPVIPDEGEY